jgi:hypothetical protein
MTDIVEEAGELLEACNAARRSSTDFPTIWNEILKNNPIVAGSPVQHMDESGPILVIQLTTGQRIVFGAQGFSIR